MTTKNGKPVRGVSKEAELLASCIDNLITARVMQLTSPGVGSEAADSQHKELAEELKRAL